MTFPFPEEWTARIIGHISRHIHASLPVFRIKIDQRTKESLALALDIPLPKYFTVYLKYLLLRIWLSGVGIRSNLIECSRISKGSLYRLHLLGLTMAYYTDSKAYMYASPRRELTEISWIKNYVFRACRYMQTRTNHTVVKQSVTNWPFQKKNGNEPDIWYYRDLQSIRVRYLWIAYWMKLLTRPNHV